jgi:dTDP-4-dehydrorhamnose reductase
MKAIILGIDSEIGRAVGNALAARGDRFVGTTRRRERVGKTMLYLNLEDPESADAGLPEADVAFFCAAVTSFADCRNQPELARRVNATTPTAIAARLVEQGTRVVLLSTSAVFDCRVPRMTADRPRLPASTYGRTKAEAEVAFLALGPSASVLRLTKVLSSKMEQRFAEWVRTLVRRKPIRVFHDLRFSPITLEHVVGALVTITDHRESGIFQVSGASDISYADAARHIARRLDVPAHLAHACSAVEHGIPTEEATAYTSLDTARLAALCGFVAPEPCEVVDSIIEPQVAAARRTAYSA